MKKLSLLLFAFCLSVMGWALNPNTDWNRLNTYVYDMGASLTTNNDTVVLTYKLNSEAVPGGDTYNDINPSSGGTGRGIQIYLLYKDEQGEWQRVQKDDGGEYAFYRGTFKKGDNTAKIPVAEIPTNCKGKELTWEARVHGNVMRTQPTIVGEVTTKPYNAYGIAVNNDPTHARFAQMFVSEAYPNKRGGWDRHGSGDVYAKANTMLEYNPMLNYVCAHHKHYHDGNTSHFASSWANGSVYSYTNSYHNEPNRVKISDDGRMFVSSFHPHASCAVVEYGRNRDAYDAYKYYSVIKNNWGDNDNLTNKDNNNPFLYRRCVGMDVKGSGENLKIILLWIDANGSSYQYNSATQYCAKFEIWEYEVGRAEKEQYLNSSCLYLPPFDTSCKYVRKVGEYNWDYTGASAGGAFYQGVIHKYNNMYCGFADIAYGTNDDVWVKIDYCFQKASQPKIIRVKLSNGATTNYTADIQDNALYGGGGILVKNGLLVTSPKEKTIVAYEIQSNGELKANNNIPVPKYTITDDRIGSWVTGLTMDYAGNLFALTDNKSETIDNDTEKKYTLNLLGIAMPYKTAITTRAKGTFTVTDPVPNILATDLRYDIVRGKNQYEFSFNVNTKPEEAQIRFYESYDAMKNSLNAVNADNYDGTNNNKPLFVYNIPSDQLKQGRIAVKLGAVGGQADANGVITNDRLPAGVLYWSVYVKAPRKSSVFAPIYRLVGQTHATEGYERKHATVNNYPETDGFGNIIVAHNPQNTTNDATRPEKGLRIYGISNSGNDEHAYTNTDRYSLRATYLNKNSTTGMLNYPRRMDVAPDGKVYIADEGSPTNDKDWKNVSNGAVVHVRGGVKVWDPAVPNNFTLFSDNKIFTATSVALWNGNLYATNTYDEYVKHLNGKTNYTKEQQANTSQYGWNGFVGYVLNKYKSPGDWDSWSGNKTDYALGRGDASGNIAIVAMDKGIWLCQHKEHNRAVKDATLQPLADNLDGYILSFVPYGSNTRTWRSCVENGVDDYDSSTKRKERADASDFSQKKTSPVQSTPGGGIAYKKVNGKEYLYVVNHDGNIAQLEITSWSGSGTAATPTIPIENIKILTTPAETKDTKVETLNGRTANWTGAYITSMTFDYAGNLVTTTGKSYHDGPQDIVIYTMPYDRVNAREIQAPNSCRMIPERIAHLDMDKEDLDELIKEHKIDHPEGCAIDLYRPIQGGMFNTICLPCTLDLKTLPEGHPLKNATLKQYTELNLNTVGGEKVLELVFTNVSDRVIIANKPYIIQPEENYNSIIRFAGPLRLTNTTGEAVNHEENSKNYNITYQGIIPYQEITPVIQDGVSLTLMLVADNRLAEMTTEGYMYGFRGYFKLNQPLPQGMRTRITTSKGTATNTTIVVDGKKVNVEKFLQEGRVYIRMGETLYTIDGQKVE